MSFYLSTGLRNALLGKQVVMAATNAAFAVTTNIITPSSGNLLNDGFRPGDYIVITNTASNNKIFTILSVASDGSTMTTNEALVAEADNPCNIVALGKNFKDLFRYHVIKIFGGYYDPTSADLADSGSLLVTLTGASGAVTPGTSTNGLEFGDPTNGVLPIGGVAVSGVVSTGGTAGYYRMYDNAVDGTVDTTNLRTIRCQGDCSTTGAEMILSNLSLTSGATVTINTHNITFPAS